MGTSGTATATHTRLQRYCKVARLGIFLSGALVVFGLITGFVIPLLSWDLSGPGWLLLLKSWAGLQTQTEGLAATDGQRWIIGLLDIAPHVLLLFALSQLWLYFGAAIHGGAFDRTALKRIGRFAIGFFGMAVAQMLRQPLVWRALTLGVAHAAPKFGPAVTLTSDQLLAVLLSAGLFAAAAVLWEAANIADEMREFV